MASAKRGSKAVPVVKPEKRPATARALSPAPKRGKPSSARSGPGRLLRRVGYWAAVFLIIATGSIALLVAYYAARLPPMAEWTMFRTHNSVKSMTGAHSSISQRWI